MSVTLIEAGLTALLELPTGPVGRNVTAKAEAVAELARVNVRSTFRTRSGNLEQSIGVFPEVTPDGLECEIGTDGAPYGRVLELGADAHPIRARNFPVLMTEPGHPVPLAPPEYRENPSRVDHPGSGPKPWLKPALEQVING